MRAASWLEVSKFRVIGEILPACVRFYRRILDFGHAESSILVVPVQVYPGYKYKDDLI